MRTFALCCAATLSLQALASDTRNPLPIYSPQPAYPAQVIGTSHGGITVVLLLVDGTGRVRNAWVERSSGERAIDMAALAAARQWVFQPSLSGGKPVDAYVRIPFHFASSTHDYGAELASAYKARIREQILSHWLRPDSVTAGQDCRLELTQLPGGGILDVTTSSACALDDVGRNSLITAARGASPLPYAGFEPVFRRQVEVDIVAP